MPSQADRLRPLPLLLLVVITLLTSSSLRAVTGVDVDEVPHWQDKRYLEKGFFEIALNGEHERLRPVVRKWVQPLRIWFYSESGDPAQQRWLVSSHFQHLTQITGLPVEFVPHRQQANVRILFTAEHDPNGMAARELSSTGRRELERSICLGQIRFNRKSEITEGVVVIPVQRAESRGKLVPCVIEEVTQMLGLVNDSRGFYPTVFSDLTDDELLTGFDLLLLKLLYSSEVRTGMTYAQLTPVIRRQLDLWERQGLIGSASAMVSESPLHAYSMR
jgi:hypothetical protein